MRKIILLCSAGMSTSILLNKMREAAEEQNYEVDIRAHSVSEVKDVAGDADVILLGPQVRFNLAAIRKQLPDKKVEVIDVRAYSTMDGEAVIEMVKEVLGD